MRVPRQNTRHSIRLRQYDYSTPGSYFVTLCARDRMPVFENQRLRSLVEDTWATLPQRFPTFTLDAFVVMPNHVHFVGHLSAQQAGASPGPTLGRIIGTFKSIVAIEWLRLVQRERPDEPAAVWQRNYYEHVVRNEEELHRIREYIANNPAMWQHDRENPNRTTDADYERVWSWIEQS